MESVREESPLIRRTVVKKTVIKQKPKVATTTIEIQKPVSHCHWCIVLEGCISQYIRLLYWRDASLNTLDYCIGGMHLSIH